MYNKINIMVPSYNRSQGFKTLVDSAINTCDDKARLVFTVMLHDDYTGYEFPELTHIMTENLKIPDMSWFFNEMYRKTKWKCEDTVVSFLGDDMEFKTKGWESILLDKINETEGVGIYFCNDAFVAGETCPVNLFSTRRFIDAAADDFMCPAYKRYYMDEAWGHVAGLVDAKYYFENVIIKHHHATTTGIMDNTYTRLQAQSGEYGHTAPMWAWIKEAVTNIKRSGVV